MAAISMSLGALNIGTAPYQPKEPMQWGSDAIQAALLTGDYRPEEMDEVVQSLGLVRQVTIPMGVRSATADAAITDQQAITMLLGQANRYTPLNLTVTPTNSTRVSTFKVWGGSWSADYTNYSSLSNVTDGTLNLQCDPFVYGAPQNIGTSGAPLITSGASPAQFTVTPTTFGDVPADIQLFVKNGANIVRSMFASTVPGNTTWNGFFNLSGASLDSGSFSADANAKGGTAVTYTNLSPATNAVVTLCHWTTPTLPTDRPFRIYLRVRDNILDGNTSFRLRHQSGNVEIVGEWRTLPSQGVNNLYLGADMGAWYFPISNVSIQGASSTVTYLETTCRTNASDITLGLDFVLYMPDESTILFETSDTGKSIMGNAGTAVIENDSVYTSTGQGAGGADIGTHIRALGSSRYMVHTGQGYLGALGTPAWTFENVTAWAVVTPRSFNLA
jgi:hypothetical protein